MEVRADWLSSHWNALQRERRGRGGGGTWARRSCQGLQQAGHLDGGLGAVGALDLHAGEGLVVVVLGGEDAVGDGHAGVEGDAGDAGALPLETSSKW